MPGEGGGPLSMHVKKRGWGLPFVARVALLACVGGLTFVVCACGGFLPYFLLADAFLSIASLSL